MRTGGRIATIAVAVVVSQPGAALALTPSPLKSGKWKTQPKGGFVVSSNHKYVSGLKLSPAGASGCGTATITVLGSHKLAIATRGGYSNWIVGHNAPKSSEGFTPIKVKVSQAGKTVYGTLSLIFAVGGYARDNDGSLTFGSCQLTFYASK